MSAQTRAQSGILDEIIASRRTHRAPAPPDLEPRAREAPPVRSLFDVVGNRRTFLIAECKKASPSRGVLARRYDPAGLARVYADDGASAISVLTEPRFFQGSPEDLVAVRQAVDLPVLRKDFILDQQDVLESRAMGADLVLLIARALSGDHLRSLHRFVTELGMEAIVEIHDQADLQRALEAQALCVGINNRDLDTFETDMSTTEKLAPLVPHGIFIISESGIRTGEDVNRLRLAGAQGVLVGEALITAEDTGALVRELVDGGCPDCWAARERAVAEGPSQ